MCIFLRLNSWSFYQEGPDGVMEVEGIWPQIAPLQSSPPMYSIAPAWIPLFRICGLEWNISLLEIYFKPWWGYSLLGKVMIQIKLLESCLDYLEKCIRGISLFVPTSRYCCLCTCPLYPSIKVNPIATLLV